MFEIDLKQVDSDIVLWSVRSFYIFASYAIIIVRFIPDLRSRFLHYGARSSSAPKSREDDNRTFPIWLRSQIDPLLDLAADMTVPHNWFSHFYIVSTICTAFWLSVFIRQLQSHLTEVASFNHIWEMRTVICMMLLQAQGFRRLFECLFISKPSKSRMWIGHYLIGITFYLVTNVAVWLELALEEEKITLNRQHLRTPEIAFEIARVLLCSGFFVQCSYKQHQVHKYLANLQKYQVPNHPIYHETNLICPHYWFEVKIYIIFSVLTARAMRILNVTMFCALAFVIVNLGVTADLTKKWLMEKFPKQRPEIAQRKKMLGGLW